jgi:hypothetical protein
VHADRLHDAGLWKFSHAEWELEFGGRIDLSRCEL